MTDWLECGKATLLIRLRRDHDREAFEANLAQVCRDAEPVDPEASPGWVRLGDDEIGPVPHQRFMRASPAPYDAVFHLRVASPEDAIRAIEPLAAAADRLAPWIDPTGSAVVVGREIAVTRGFGPVKIVMPLRRLPAQTHDAFMHHWFDEHAELGADIPDVRYRQNHIDDALTRAANEAMSIGDGAIDGFAESYFDTIDAAERIMVREDIAVAALEDEKRFIDHVRSQFGFYRRLA